jgi:flavin reductase (DIM6/NTAB) family NADH-FMN oxidoreductase RutF
VSEQRATDEHGHRAGHEHTGPAAREAAAMRARDFFAALGPEADGRIHLDAAVAGRHMYPLLNSAVVPRPIAWVSSLAEDGAVNLAPHSYFTVASVEPPVVSFTSIGRKDSQRNIEATGEFVVNLVTEDLAQACNLTGTDFPPEVDEFAAVGLEKAASRLVRPPRVAGSPVALECRLVHTWSAGGASTVIFGEVVHTVLDPAAVVDGLPDMSLVRPASRLNKDLWGHAPDLYELRRVPYATWQEQHTGTRSAG